MVQQEPAALEYEASTMKCKSQPPCRLVEKTMLHYELCGKLMTARTLRYQHSRFCRPLTERREQIAKEVRQRVYELQAQNEALLQQLMGCSPAAPTPPGNTTVVPIEASPVTPTGGSVSEAFSPHLLSDCDNSPDVCSSHAPSPVSTAITACELPPNVPSAWTKILDNLPSRTVPPPCCFIAR
jgi:hypothetical protein